MAETYRYAAMRLWPALLAIATLAPVGPATAQSHSADDNEQGMAIELGPETGSCVTELHFGVNVEFFRPGIAAGVTDRRHDFAKALRDSGIRALRFPGGNPAYFYLPESRELTMELGHSCGWWSFREGNPPNTHFVTLTQLARFARFAGIKLIYELPCLFYLDGDTPRAIIKSAFSDRADNFDQDRIDQGVAYGMGIVRRLRDLGAPIAAWELGNEEFANCEPDDYGRVVAAYAKAIHRVDAETPLIAVGMGKNWLPQVVPVLEDLGAVDLVDAFQVHYPYGNWPGPPSEDQRGSASAFVSGNLRMERFLDGFQETKVKLGIEGKPTAVTETMAMRHQNWDPSVVIGTYAHALCYAWNWMTLLERPEVNAAVFHDLESPYFGMLRYDVGFDPQTRHFVWLEAAENAEPLDPEFDDKYVLSPTCYSNRLLSRLAGLELVETNIERTPGLRVAASRRVIVVVNRQDRSVRLTVPFASASIEVLTADSLDACLPGAYGIERRDVGSRHGELVVDGPPYSVMAVRGTQ